MTTIDINNTLAELVDSYPRLPRELERLGLDYCCGGARSLAEACTARGLDPAATATALAELAGEREEAEWTSMSIAELCDHLVATHHRYLWDEMPRITALIDKIRTVHGERHPELESIARCFAELVADLEPHLMKEERILFPMVHELESATGATSFHCGSLRNPISVMLTEHDRVGELLEQMRRLTADYQPPADGCGSYVACFTALEEFEADTHLHVHKENNVLFPKVVAREAELAGAGQ